VPEDARPWLIGVARNVRLNVRRSQRRQQSVVSALRETGLQERVEEASFGLPEDLAGALDALPASDREVLLLHAWDDLDTAQIATALGCSKANASLRLHRAKRRFEKVLGARTDMRREIDRSSTATGEGAVDGC